MGIPVVKSIYEHLPTYDSETWEYQDLLVSSVPATEEDEENEVHDLRMPSVCHWHLLRAQHLHAFVPA